MSAVPYARFDQGPVLYNEVLNRSVVTCMLCHVLHVCGAHTRGGIGVILDQQFVEDKTLDLALWAMNGYLLAKKEASNPHGAQDWSTDEVTKVST